MPDSLLKEWAVSDTEHIQQVFYCLARERLSASRLHCFICSIHATLSLVPDVSGMTNIPGNQAKNGAISIDSCNERMA